ncbi:hypothetical protein [Aquabacterium sp.]|uniref:hypothetical protein n=1 Tax=Aquabacterium sp. TaxID=1872578 RepID=UPI0025BFDE41|nr:hypothetical protein [Aquabacterium sp.]
MKRFTCSVRPLALTLACGLALIGPTWAQTSAPTPVQTPEAASDVAPEAAAPLQAERPQALSYSVRWQAGKVSKVQTWYLLRDGERAVVQRPELEDIWTRSAQGHIGFERVFHADRSVVAYSTGELKTLNVYPQWDSLATLFDARKLPQLQRVGRDAKAGVTRYKGRMGHEQIEVDWLDEAGVAQRVLRQEQGRSVRFTLQARHALPPASWPVPARGTEAYQRYDAADFGDMENNPVIRKASHMDVLAGWRQPHEHD